jgi:hypothetical protein
MPEERLALSELLEKSDDGDFLRTVAGAVLQLLMEADVEGLIGAGRYERRGERMTWRCADAHRPRGLVAFSVWRPQEPGMLTAANPPRPSRSGRSGSP